SETSQSEYSKEVKKSGIFGSGGLGFTIGSQKQKDSYDNQAVEQVGSTIGSIQGNVTLESGKDVDIKASEVIAGSGINITGESVTIENGDNDYNAQEKHEFKQSGLSVSLGGQTIETAQSIAASLKRADQVEDERLKQLYQYKAYETLKENKGALEGIKNIDNPKSSNLQLNVSLGTSKSESSYKSETELNQGSNLYATGDVNVKATEKDITLKGSEITGENVNLDAKENINVIAGTNKNVGKGENSSSSASIGVSIDFSGISGINAGYNKANGEVKENAETHIASTITAKDTLTTKSGQDTNIIGSKLEGNSVKMEVGKDLNIESLQDKEIYDEKNSSSGFNFSADIKVNADTGKNQFQNAGITGGKNKGNTNSTYESVTDQAGIYAGEGGFDIEVGKNTDLKGAVIASEADASKNKLSTDTLTYSDIENKAEYSSSSSGFNVDTRPNAKDKDKGITPNIGVTSSGEADSTTKSAIADGTIEIRSNPNQDLSGLNRDTQNALNALEKIFDKKTVAEQQELANLFGEIAFKAVGDLAAKKQVEAAVAKEMGNDYEKAAQEALKKGDTKNAELYENIAKQYRKIEKELAPWQEGGANKIVLHALVGGMMSTLGGNGFTSGAVGAGLNETFQKELAKIKDPDVHQWASALVGATTAKIVGGDAKTGASTAVSGTKNNELGGEYVDSLVNWIVDQCKPEIKNSINNLIDIGLLSDPHKMEHDYRVFMNGAALPIKFVAGSCGYILDSKANVYVLVEASGGFGVSTPITLTDGFGDFKAMEKENANDYRRTIEGWSFGGGGAAGVQVTASVSTSGVVSSEVTGTTAAGTTLFSGRYVKYLFNLDED
ncbi:hemagglutinin repeat-containing protein, partial [Anaerosinus sp.]|uniref:hemagglutinin repeat-containing protein n=1 Tax=Selenobaculum sp. TaxID=3074374 RepID=UPI003AB49FF9